MVKKSKKSKSKRVSLKKKYKIIRKVKEHHKKKAKEAKKLGPNHKSKVEKDPGIPNDWPFKEQELKALEARRARAIEELEQKKVARKERAQKRKLGLVEDDDIAPSKQRKIGEENSVEESAAVFSKSRDNSDKAFYKELVKVIEASDVILEVLDARDPLGTRCVDMEKLVLKSGPEKHLVLLLNKIDLVPREAVEKWLNYLREELPAVAFKCSTQEQKSNYGWKSGKVGKGGKGGKSASKLSKPSSILQTSDCLGAETLLKLLKNYSRSHEIKKSITVGVIGLPNVGKSSLINSLKRCRVVNVGATPGLTRSLQEVQLDKNVKLLDCPGVVMLKSEENDASVVLRNCKRIEKLDDPIAPVKEILKLCPAKMLVSLYKLPSFDSVDDFLQKVATVRGKLKKGGAVDVESAARIVLHDWNEGKIPYYTMPPTRNQGETFEATIVTELGKEFNVDEVYKGESSFIGSLVSLEDFSHVEVPPSCPLNFDEKMLEDDDEQPKALTQGNEQPEGGDEDGDDHPMDSQEKDLNTTKAKTINSKQNEKLYTAEGILNTRLKKAEKKKRKKANKFAALDSIDADYDFKVYRRASGTAQNLRQLET
ncbi:GTP binding domain [Macleaya cordata]|uniref:GTP binding domain n=1 Tax=Macleaya cordata TaxID=56857 RepID=A0A200PTP4_MACCD|nr:GTP binding domain [Macleaya cordata]